MERVLVTGANSFLGTNVVIELINRGYSVRALVRSSNKVLDEANIEIFNGNIAYIEDVISAANGCSYIIHIAAVTNQNLLKYDEYETINIGGCKNVIIAAKENAVKRVIYVSTANTMGYGTIEKLGNETSPMLPPFTKSMYAKSKQAGQDLMLAASKQGDFDVVILNPTFMLGRYDSKPSSGKIILMGYKKKLQFIPSGGKNFIYVGDAATAVCNSISMGRNGEKYLLSGVNMSYKEFFNLLNDVTGYKSSFITLPPTMLKSIGYLGNLLRKCGLEVAFSKSNMDILCITNYFSNEKAKREIGLPETSIKNAIEEAIEYFIANGIINTK